VGIRYNVSVSIVPLTVFNNYNIYSYGCCKSQRCVRESFVLFLKLRLAEWCGRSFCHSVCSRITRDHRNRC